MYGPKIVTWLFLSGAKSLKGVEEELQEFYSM